MKRIIALFLILCFSSKTVAQNTITATITGFKNQCKVRLSDRDMMMCIDSTYIVDNQFVLKHNLQSTVPRNLYIVIIDENGPTLFNLYIANDNIKINGDKKDFPYDLKITGSADQDLQNILNEKVKNIQNERTTLANFLRAENVDQSENHKALVKSKYLRIDQIDRQNDSIVKAFIVQNINSYVALNQLRYFKESFSKEDLIKLYQKLEGKYKSSEDSKSLFNYIEIGEVVKEGDLFSDFEAKDKNGKTHRLSDFKGQLILLDFTKEYCAPCELAIREMKVIQEKHKDKIKIISFTGEKSELFWQKGLLRNNISWLSLWDGQGYYGKTLLKYGVQGFPNFFIINDEGRIVKRIDGYYNNLETELQKLIN